MLLYTDPVAPECRTAVIQPCESACHSQNNDIDAVATFNMRLRDKLDFTVDFTAWLARNGGAQLSAATFAVAAGSPQTPTISGQAFGVSGKCIVVIQPANDAAVGDAYYLDLTATVAATTGDPAIPARTLVRRIHVVLVNG